MYKDTFTTISELQEHWRKKTNKHNVSIEE